MLKVVLWVVGSGIVDDFVYWGFELGFKRFGLRPRGFVKGPWCKKLDGICVLKFLFGSFIDLGFVSGFIRLD